MKPKPIKSNAPQPLANYTEAYQAGDYIFAAGQLASDLKTGVPPVAKVDPNFPFYGSDIKKQTEYILKNLQKTFEAAGTSMDNVVKAQVFLTDLMNFNAFDEVWKKFFKTAPPRTTVGTTGLLVKDTLVEIDLIAYKPSKNTKRKTVKSSAPQPLANYTEANVVGDLIFAAGQLASDFKTGVPAEARVDPAFPYYGSDIKKQTRFILDNLKKTFKAAGSSLDNVVKAQVFITDPNLFNGFDEVWREFFKTSPARTTVGTTGLLVKDTLVEIDLIGYVPRKGLKVQKIKSGTPQPIANYSEGFRVGDFVFAAGQVASDFEPGVGVPEEADIDFAYPYYGSDIKKQTDYILKNLAKTFKAAGSSLDKVIKAQVFLTDLDDFSEVDEVWKKHFKTPPARTTVGVPALLLDETRIEIDLVGVA